MTCPECVLAFPIQQQHKETESISGRVLCTTAVHRPLFRDMCCLFFFLLFFFLRRRRPTRERRERPLQRSEKGGGYSVACRLKWGRRGRVKNGGKLTESSRCSRVAGRGGVSTGFGVGGIGCAIVAGVWRWY